MSTNVRRVNGSVETDYPLEMALAAPPYHERFYIANK